MVGLAALEYGYRTLPYLRVEIVAVGVLKLEQPAIWFMPAMLSRSGSLYSMPRSLSRFLEQPCTEWHRPTDFIGV